MIRPIKLTEINEIRFWEKVDMRGPDECWEWTEYRDKDGYGRFHDCNNRPFRAHRIAFVIANGDTDLWVCHRCDNPPCCNPAHLYAGTVKDDACDCVDRGRTACGEKNGQAELTESDVHEIRKLYANGWSQRGIAEEYGISQSQVSRICSGRGWKHI